MKYYEDDRPRPIPEEYLKMSQDELDCEIERLYQKYYGNKEKQKTISEKTTCSVQFYF